MSDSSLENIFESEPTNSGLNGVAIFAALKGNNVPGSEVTLRIEKRTGKIEDVALTRVLTASVADKRKLFDLFTGMADRANKARVSLQNDCCRERQGGGANVDCF